MMQELKNNYEHLFEDTLLNEINQVETFKEIPEGI
jgi:CRP/FNR family transcriptional regulator